MPQLIMASSRGAADEAVLALIRMGVPASRGIHPNGTSFVVFNCEDSHYVDVVEHVKRSDPDCQPITP